MSLDIDALKLQLKNSNSLQQRIESCIQSGNLGHEDKKLELLVRNQDPSASSSFERHDVQSPYPGGGGAHYESLKEV